MGKSWTYAALTIAYATATAYHFQMNRHFTFRSGAVDGGISATLPKYVSVVLLNYVISLIVVRLVMSAGFHIEVGMFAGIVLTTIVLFVLAKSWSFRASRRRGNAPKTMK